MDSFLEIIKVYLLPGSFEFLIIGLLLGVVLIVAHRDTRPWGIGLLTFLGAVYLILSLPLTARTFERVITDPAEPLQQAGQAEGAGAIVVLGGGSATYRASGNEINELSGATALRVLEAARLYDLLNDPSVIASGGADELLAVLTPESVPMQQELMDLGVPSERIILESQSGNTREQAENIARVLEANDIERFVLVTSPIHMRRAVLTMREFGLDPIPSPSSQHSEGNIIERGSILPDPVALRASHAAVREALAILYYWFNGWTLAPWTP